jgi:hypothetical protein
MKYHCSTKVGSGDGMAELIGAGVVYLVWFRWSGTRISLVGVCPNEEIDTTGALSSKQFNYYSLITSLRVGAVCGQSL